MRTRTTGLRDASGSGSSDGGSLQFRPDPEPEDGTLRGSFGSCTLRLGEGPGLRRRGRVKTVGSRETGQNEVRVPPQGVRRGTKEGRDPGLGSSPSPLGPTDLSETHGRRGSPVPVHDSCGVGSLVTVPDMDLRPSRALTSPTRDDLTPCSRRWGLQGDGPHPRTDTTPNVILEDTERTHLLEGTGYGGRSKDCRTTGGEDVTVDAGRPHSSAETQPSRGRQGDEGPGRGNRVDSEWTDSVLRDRRGWTRLT